MRANVSILNSALLLDYVQSILPCPVLLPAGTDSLVLRQCDAINTDARLSRAGRKLLFRQLAGHVQNYALIEAALAQQANLERESVERPVFIIGLPRSGTSLLYYLLALDFENRPLRMAEALRPMSAGAGFARARRQHAVRWCELMQQSFSGLTAIFEMQPESLAECCFLKRNSLRCYSWFYQSAFDGVTDVWLSKPVLRECYQHYRQQLQLIQRQVSGGRWLLKCPTHYPALGALAKCFPDAIFLNTVRKLEEVIPSFASLISQVRGGVSPHGQQHEIGRQILDMLQAQIAMHRESRAQLKGGQVLDIRYDELVRDPVRCVQQIYEYQGLRCSAGFVRAMQKWLQCNPQHRRGKHDYSLRMFGLEREHVWQKFGAYADEFLGVSAPGTAAILG